MGSEGLLLIFEKMIATIIEDEEMMQLQVELEIKKFFF